MRSLREALRDLPDAAFADLLESEEDYLLVLDLPGVTAETLDVTAEGGLLRIEAYREKDVPEGFTYRREERPMFLDADLPLPPDATAEGASARIEGGVLEVTLPKGGPTTEIEVSGSGTEA